MAANELAPRSNKIDMDMRHNIYKILYMAAYFNQIDFVTIQENSKEIEKKNEIEKKLRQEEKLKNDIYVKFLANRVKSSLVNDFLTMRFIK